MKSAFVLRVAATAVITSALWACSANPSVVPNTSQNAGQHTAHQQDSDVPQTPH